MDDAWVVTKAIINETNSLAHKNNVTFILIIGNAKLQVNPSIWNDLVNEFHILADKEWDLIEEMLNTFLAEEEEEE